jgi:hypothetical protein
VYFQDVAIAIEYMFVSAVSAIEPTRSGTEERATQELNWKLSLHLTHNIVNLRARLPSACPVHIAVSPNTFRKGFRSARR